MYLITLWKLVSPTLSYYQKGKSQSQAYKKEYTDDAESKLSFCSALIKLQLKSYVQFWAPPFPIDGH